MLLRSGSIMLILAITLVIIWAYNNYKYAHQHNPLITNVIQNQNDYRNISRPWGNLDRYRNLQAKQKKQAEKQT